MDFSISLTCFRITLFIGLLFLYSDEVSCITKLCFFLLRFSTILHQKKTTLLQNTTTEKLNIQVSSISFFWSWCHPFICGFVRELIHCVMPLFSFCKDKPSKSCLSSICQKYNKYDFAERSSFTGPIYNDYGSWKNQRHVQLLLRPLLLLHLLQHHLLVNSSPSLLSHNLVEEPWKWFFLSFLWSCSYHFLNKIKCEKLLHRKSECNSPSSYVNGMNFGSFHNFSIISHTVKSWFSDLQFSMTMQSDKMSRQDKNACLTSSLSTSAWIKL